MPAFNSVLVTGGAGFVGARLALGFKEHGCARRVIALDNLKRRGSELSLPRLKKGGVEFLHGDVRVFDDLPTLKGLDLILECSAEPSVLAGYHDAPAYVIDSNLTGAAHCMELARRAGSAMLFLSTSRVYPVSALRSIRLIEGETRFETADDQDIPGVSTTGISESFPLEGARSLYGATKLAAELLLAEYAEMYGARAVINRCGVIAGPWQMGRIDQGVVGLWAARHVYGGSLAYIGFGGTGKQVRDLLHVDDLLDLALAQAKRLDTPACSVFNVGGGIAVSVSLRELTDLCREASGNTIPITSVPETRPADVPLYVSDHSRVTNAWGWTPRRAVETIVLDTTRWIRDHADLLRPVLAD